MEYSYSLAEGSIWADKVKDHMLNLKFVMVRRRGEILTILFDGEYWSGPRHSDVAGELIDKLGGGSKGEDIEFIGAGGLLDPVAKMFAYNGYSCQHIYGKVCPEDSAEAEGHLIELRKLLGWGK